MTGRPVKALAGTFAAVLLLVAALVGAVLVSGNTDWGRMLIERVTLQLTGGHVRLAGLGGTFPRHPTLRHLELTDAQGIWLTADDVAADWSPLALLENRIRVDRLRAARVHMERLPVSDQAGGSVSIPHIEVGSFTIGTAELGAPLTGTPVALSGYGTFEMRSLEDANGVVSARRVGGDGEYEARLKIDRRRVDGSLSMHEPAGGPLEHLLQLPGLGALSVTARLQGPRSAVDVQALLAAGDLHAGVTGRVDLVHAAAELDYAFSAPALAPRPDLSWSAAELKGTWRGPLTAPLAEGRLAIDGLRLGDQVKSRRVIAKLSGAGGRLALQGLVEGIELPGPQPRLFAADPIQIDATLQMNASSRPLELTAVHRLFKLHGRLDTVTAAGAAHAAGIELTVPEVQPFAAFAGMDVRGRAQADARVGFGDEGVSVKANAGLAVSGGTAPGLAALGPQLELQLSGALTNDAVTIQSLRVDGRAAALTVSGSAVRTRGTEAGFVKTLQSRWQIDLSDLSALSEAVAGSARLSGRLGGAPVALAGEAQLMARLSVRGSAPGVIQASVTARGVPAAPSGTIQAHGMLDGAPLDLDAELERQGGGELRLQVRRAQWKTAHADGDLSTDTGLTRSRGQLHVQVDQLGDFSRLLELPVGGRINGRVGFVPAGDHTQAQVSLDATDFVVGQFAGNLHLQGAGVSNALALELNAQLPNLRGSAAGVDAAGMLDLDSRAFTLSELVIGYREETLRLLAPSRVAFDQGLSVDEIKVGAGEAFLDLHGRLTPALDMRAALQKVGPDLVNHFMPGLLSAGMIDGRARLQGSLEHPTGTIRFDATGLQFADDAAAGLPPADLHTRVEIDGDAAAVNGRLSAGSGSLLTLSGTAPLSPSGSLNLEVGGKLDVGLLSPLLEARGWRAAGRLSVDAEVTGPTSGPTVSGSIVLAGGSVHDYVRGVNLTDVNAEVEGGDGGLRIKTFTAKAAAGTLTLTGSLGVLQSGMPIDLKLVAKHAQPITSNIVTANLDADLHLGGTLRERIDLAGAIHVNRAVIGIPDSLPPDVAVLDVRRRGGAVPASPERQLVIGLDVDLHADSQILVQGRGLDAELGGEIHLTGTTDAPVASGSFDLQRGTFTIAGSKLDFTDGRVGFDGAGLAKKIDPTLDFTAQTSLGTNTAKLHITGMADAPRFEFTSSSGQSTDEIMAQLLFGENAAQLTALQAAQIAYALATLTGGGGSINPLVKLQKSLGLDRLTVGSNTTTSATGATEASGAAIAAGRYVTKRVYVEGRQTTAGTSQVQVDVDLTKHLKLQTRLGNGTANTQGTTPENDPGSSVGLSYQFEY